MPESPRKKSITLSAIEIVHESGFHGLTTREIARREGISEAALYRHFKNRNEIVGAVITYYAKFDRSFVESVAGLALGPVDSIVHIIEKFAEHYEGNPAMSSIINAFDSMQYDAGFAQTTSEIYMFRKTTVERLLRKAIAEGEVQRDVDPGAFSSVIWSAFFSQVYEWRSKGCSYSLKTKTSHVIRMLLLMAIEKMG